MKSWMTTLVIAGLASAAVAAPGFTVDEIIPGEGHEGDCYLRLWRENTKSMDGDRPRSVFEDGGGLGFVKIDGQMVIMKPVNNAETKTSRHAIFADTQKTVQVEHNVRVVQTDLHPDGDTLHLKGTLRVDYQGQSQVLRVGGEEFCYSG